MSETRDEELSKLLEEITAAFDGVPRGDGPTLHQAVWIDQFGMKGRSDVARVKKERLDARLKDREGRWQDIPDEVLGKQKSPVLPHLHDDGLLYYLPAFMCWVAKNYEEESGSMASIMTLLTLCPFKLHQKETGLDAWQVNRLKHLNSPQRAAAIHFLEPFN